MKASQFKALIKEAVREVLKEELQELVQPQQAPVQEQVQTRPVQSTGNPILDALNETRGSMTSEDYQNIGGGNLRAQMAQNFSRSSMMPGQRVKPVSDDPQAVAQAIAAAPKQGLDLSQLGFVNKAAAIVNEADRKQKEKFSL